MTKNNIKTHNYSVIHNCRLCNSDRLITLIEFGNVPLANAYPISKTDNEDLYPLTLMSCSDCGHVQLRETVNPEILFSEYSYASSDSPSLLRHFKEYAAQVTLKLNLRDNDSILEIGSNDGILLKEFAKLGFTQLYGVEPANNLAIRSIGNGAIIFNQFFNTELSNKILTTHGKMNVICANNVLAHVADIDSIFNGIVNLLTDDGVLVFENAYLLDTIQGLYFDQIYGEHLQYYGIIPLIKYLAKFNLRIFDIEHVSTQGGSFRVFAKRVSNFKQKIKPSVEDFIRKESEYKLYDFITYADFQAKIKTLVNQVKSFVSYARSQNKTISCYGCPAKFALFSKVFDLNDENIVYVVDDSPLKQNKYSPGKKIPIVNNGHFKNNPTDYCIVSSWNMAEHIIKGNSDYTGKWVIPMPDFKII